MSRCVNCGKKMQSRRDLCGPDCAKAWIQSQENVMEGKANEIINPSIKQLQRYS